jgi:lysophospholipase L1-like esterase
VKRRKINCYPAQLEKLLGSGCCVRNFGANGHALQKNADKPYWEHPYFKAGAAFAPQLVLIMLGTNDASERNWKGVDPYIADYREMIDFYKALPSRPQLILLTPPTQFHVENYTKVIHTMRNEELEIITEAIKELGKELGITVVDINAATKDHPECFEFDGLHPDAAGARLIAETVYPYLLPAIIDVTKRIPAGKMKS